MSFDPDVEFPLDKFIRIRDVAVFDEHEGLGHGNKPKRVTADDLERLARNCNQKVVQVRAPTPLAIGHSKDGEDVKEQDQPPICGWAVNFKVAPLLDTGRKALYCDWYVKRQYARVIEDYPHRSIEWYRGRDDINPISLLKTAPERDLPIIKYSLSATEGEEPYRYVFTPPPNPIGPTPPTPTGQSMNDQNPQMAEAQASETSSFKEAVVTMAQVAQQLAAITPMLAKLAPVIEALGQVLQEPEPAAGEGEDLMQPAPDDGSGYEEEEQQPQPAQPEEKKTPKKDDSAEAEEGDEGSDKKPESDKEEPVKMNAGYAGPDNAYTPTTEKKNKMARTDEEKVKFQREIADLRRENDEFKIKFQRIKAEKTVADLETVDRIDFGTVEDREEELDLLSKLPDDVFATHVDKIKRKYKRKADPKPDSAGAAETLKYARTEGPTTEWTEEDVIRFSAKLANDPSLTPEKYMASKTAAK